MTEVESPEETVILTYCHHDDEEEGNEGGSRNSDEHSSSLRSCEQLLHTGVEGSEGGDELTTDILTWPSHEDKIDTNTILPLPSEEDADSFSDCAISVGENEGIEFCLSAIIEETNTKGISDPSCFKVQSPAKLFANAFCKRIKKVPLQQNILIPDFSNDIHNDRVTTPMDGGTNGAAVVDHQGKNGSEMALSCDVEASSEETSLLIQAADNPTSEETSPRIQAADNSISEETSPEIQAADNTSSPPLDNCDEQPCIPYNPTLVSHSSAKMKGKTPEDTAIPHQPSQEVVDEPLRGILRYPTIISRSSSEMKEITPSEPYNNGHSSMGHNPTILSRSNSSKLDDPPLDDSWKQQISINPLVRTNRVRKMKAISKKNHNQILKDPWKPQIQNPKNLEPTVFIRPNDDPLLDDLWKPQNITHQKTFVDKIYGKGWLRKKRTATRGINAVSESLSLDTVGEEILLEPSYMMAEKKDLSTTHVISKEEEQVKKYPMMASNNDTDAMDDKIDVNLANETFLQSPATKDAAAFHSPNTASSELQIQNPKNLEPTVFIRPNDDPLLDDLWKPQNTTHQKTFVDKIYGKGWLRKKRTATRGINAVSESLSLDTIGEELLLEPSYMMAEKKDLSTTHVISKEEEQVKKYPMMASNNDTDAMDDKIDVNLANETFLQSPATKDAAAFHSPNAASSELDIPSSFFCCANDYSTFATTRVHSMDGIGAQGNRNVTPTEPIGEDFVSFTVESTSGLVKIYPASKSVEADNDRVESKPSDGIISEKHTTFFGSSDTSGALSRQDDTQGNEGLEQLDQSKDSISSIPDCPENAVEDDYMAPKPRPAAGDSNKPPQTAPKNRFKMLKFASNSKRSSEKSLWMKKKVEKEKKQDNDGIIPSDLTKKIVIYESPILEPQGSAKPFKEGTTPKASRKKALPPGMSGKRDHIQSPNAGHSWDESTGISFFTLGTVDTSFDTTLSTVSVEDESDSSYGSVGESTHAYSDFHKNDIAESQCDGTIPNLFSSMLKQLDQIFDCGYDTTTKSYNEDRRNRK